MRISADERLTNAKHISHLPPHVSTLHELTRINNETFERCLADGTIHPEMGRTEAAGLRPANVPSSDQLNLFAPSIFALTGTGRKLEKALRRHVYAQAKLTKDSESIIRLVVQTVRSLEKLAGGTGEPSGFVRIQAEFHRLEEGVHRLMGPSRVPR
jgi:hypothetical protein